MNQNNRIAIAVLVIAALAVIAYFVWKTPVPHAPVTSDTATTTATTTGESINVSSTTASTGVGYTIAPVDMAAIKAPESKNPLTFPSSITADVRASMQTTFAQVQSTIKAKPRDFDAWMTLGALRKQTGDYAGAETVWKYISTLYPKNPASFGNLADLYTNYTHEYAKAAAAYKSAIANDPTRAQLYQDLYDLSTNQYPQSVAFIETSLKSAIKNSAKSYQLQLQLARYYVATHNTVSAKASYEAAIANAKSQGKADVAAEIAVEAARI